MPSIVAVSVRNCAIASNTFAAMSWSLLMSIDTKAKAVATAKDATASNLSRNRDCMTQPRLVLIHSAAAAWSLTAVNSECCVGRRHRG